MFVASIAHMLAFPVGPYKTQSTSNWLSNIASVANVSDLHYEVTSHYNHFSVKVRNAFKKKTSFTSEPNEATDLLEEENKLVDHDEGIKLRVD